MNGAGEGARIEEFDYHLLPELIAQEPPAERDESGLLVLRRSDGGIEHRRFFQIDEYLRPGDLLVMNNTRVTAVRLLGRKPTGARVEALLVRDAGGGRWEAFVKPGRRVDVGQELLFDEELTARVVGRTAGGGRTLDFGAEAAERIERLGSTPLPPYIHRALEDRGRYQTVYASEPGSAAAPTAGFHFTPGLLRRLRERGIGTAEVTLHVGIATFRPVREEFIRNHVMHTERISVSPEAAEAVNSAQGRIISVGTTTARVLESAAVKRRRVAPVEAETNLFITPGYEFKIVDGLVTNFHMPRSTLMILVSAFAGREHIMRAYAEAGRSGYRFLSFGDAMLIL